MPIIREGPQIDSKDLEQAYKGDTIVLGRFWVGSLEIPRIVVSLEVPVFQIFLLKIPEKS